MHPDKLTVKQSLRKTRMYQPERVNQNNAMHGSALKGTFNVLCRLVGIIFHNHLNEVQALDYEPLKCNSRASLRENIADSKLQRTLNQGGERVWVILQKV